MKKFFERNKTEVCAFSRVFSLAFVLFVLKSKYDIDALTYILVCVMAAVWNITAFIQYG